MISWVVQGVNDGWSRNEPFRPWLVEFAGRFDGRPEGEHQELVEERSPLTITVCNAVSAASIEHIWSNDRCRPPGWMEKPERYRDGLQSLPFEWTENVFCHLPTLGVLAPGHAACPPKTRAPRRSSPGLETLTARRRAEAAAKSR